MQIPIIFLTGTTSTEEKIRGLELGAIGLHHQAVRPGGTAARIRASLRTKYLVDLLAKKAMIDGLTGLWNRAYLDCRLNAELALDRAACPVRFLASWPTWIISKRSMTPMATALATTCCAPLAAAPNRSCREEDVVCRYGGEEFAILLPNTGVQQAVELAERSARGGEGPAPVYHDVPVPISCSFGVADMGETCRRRSLSWPMRRCTGPSIWPRPRGNEQ